MEDLLGWLFLLSICLSIFICTKNYPHIRNFLLTAFLLRTICVLFDHYEIVTLPDSYGDSGKFESKALELSKDYGLLAVIDFYKNGYLNITIISIFYSIFGESKMMAQSISVALGTASVYLVYQLSLMVWDYTSAKKAAWVTAFFPTLILYSSLILRETYVVFFLLVGLIGIAKFMRNKTISSFLQILVSFYILKLLHGPAVIGGLIFFIYSILSSIKKILININHLKVNLSNLFFLILLLIPITLFFIYNIKIPYLPSLFDFSTLISKSNIGMISAASYPSWLSINSNYELITKGIIKAFYFLYSPFIWDIRTPYHIFGLLDGMLYFILTIYLFKNWQVIWANPITRIFILLFICYIVVYALGVGNFGTGIRHRSKFVVIFIVLAAPKIHKFIFSTKEKLYKR